MEKNLKFNHIIFNEFIKFLIKNNLKDRLFINIKNLSNGFIGFRNRNDSRYLDGDLMILEFLKKKIVEEKSGSSIISQLFAWIRSPEGYGFWYHHDTKFKIFCNDLFKLIKEHYNEK